MAWAIGDYCTLTDIKYDQEIVDSAGTPIPTTKNDTLLEELIHRSSREIDLFCSRHFYGVSETREFDALDSVDGDSLLLDDDLAAVGTITLGTGDVLGSSDYVLLPYNVVPKHQIKIKASSAQWWAYDVDPEAAISVSGTWGYVSGTTPPEPIRQACVALVRWRYKQRQAPFEQAGLGDLGAYNVSSGIPQDVQRMLMPYVKYRFGAISPGGYRGG